MGTIGEIRWTWLAVPVVLLALAGCGSTKAVTASSAASSSNGWNFSGATTATSPVQLPLAFDSEENAFMGNPDPQHSGLNRTGCFAVVETFDSESEEVCDCVYRQLRAKGYPASQLAAVASSVTNSIKTQASMPEWFGTEITRCWANLDGNS